jgi:hypothetical protein
MGFCHDALPGLLPWGYHGPLVVALDSSVLIDLQQHGNLLLNGEVPGVDEGYAEDLAGFADLLNLWLLRDIRFVVTPKSLTDARRVTQRFLNRRLSAVDAIAESLAFQFGDWTIPAPSHRPSLRHVGKETRLPQGPDRDLVLEAQAVGAHAFLTRDQEVLEKTALSGPALSVLSPRLLADELVLRGVQPFFGGTCGAHGCPYDGSSMLAPDMGKWEGYSRFRRRVVGRRHERGDVQARLRQRRPALGGVGVGRAWLQVVLVRTAEGHRSSWAVQIRARADQGKNGVGESGHSASSSRGLRISATSSMP